MRYLPIVFACLPLVFATCSRPPARQPISFAFLGGQLDSLFREFPEFSGVVLIADKGKPVYDKAFGYKNFETREHMTTASVFELASISKQFTAMTIMMLKQEGKLSYDDLIEKYLPGLPYPGITIRHLLNHTSGLPDYQDVMDKHWDKTKVANNADNIAYLIQYHPPKLAEPGAKYAYSNTGYMLLASITEKVSGQDFIDFCRARIFKPLNMTHTDIRTQEEKNKLTDMAWGHLYVPEKKRYVRAETFPESNYAIWLGNRKGPGRMSATSDDLLKWDRALYGNHLVNQKTLSDAFMAAHLNDGSSSPYGFGWELAQSARLGRVVRHSGSNPGYKNQIIRYIDADRTIILLCNNADEKMPVILKEIQALVE
ncbi:serine hydrolase domain-containing protein [Spirosoma endophyticum]|uniref:CubicO group peptidase, beta-lactamase class C family n=1 Tax=Spirosoma endophyticum TaxID=662367 RepID=A0A1I1IL23_9BACT|nr:serine hydrolase domain-containing protein [Spirosoma endophyticum]SFC34483.1 CubicO group peptidase, beta-lactamase class C family [Spirosoma endophyticum]